MIQKKNENVLFDYFLIEINLKFGGDEFKCRFF